MYVYIVYTRLCMIYMNFHIIDHNSCISHPCQNGGSCDNTAQGFQCVCTENYEGTMCACKCVLHLPEKHMCTPCSHARLRIHIFLYALNYQIQHHLNLCLEAVTMIYYHLQNDISHDVIHYFCKLLHSMEIKV